MTLSQSSRRIVMMWLLTTRSNLLTKKKETKKQSLSFFQLAILATRKQEEKLMWQFKKKKKCDGDRLQLTYGVVQMCEIVKLRMYVCDSEQPSFQIYINLIYNSCHKSTTCYG